MNKPRQKMSRADRAKQFMPFAALKGYEEALREKERVIVSCKVIPEDAAEQIDRTLHQLQPWNLVTVIYFPEHQYLKCTGTVSQIDKKSKMLKIVNTWIPMTAICDIRID